MSNYIGSSKQKLDNKLIGLIVIVAMTFISINTILKLTEM